jgi:phosphoglycerate dehydrogenase-like enzyme
MTKIAVLDDWQGIAESSTDWSPLMAVADVVFFQQAFNDEDAAVRNLTDFEIVLTMRERTLLPGSLIKRLPKLRMLGITGSQNAVLDVAACTAQGVMVCNTVGSGKSEAATAELALGLLLSAARAIPAADTNMRAGRFQEGLPVGISLAGKTIGIIGLGRLGSHMHAPRYALARRTDRGRAAGPQAHLDGAVPRSEQNKFDFRSIR